MRPRDEMLVVTQEAPIADVIDRSLEQRIKLVAVTDAAGRLVGMADRADLLAALSPTA
jgi:CBS domain-containing protein